MTGNFNQLYKIQEQTLKAISESICIKRGLPTHNIPEISFMRQIAGLENVYQAVPNSMLADHYVWIGDNIMNYLPALNNEQIAIIDNMGGTPRLATAETSNRPVFYYNEYYEGYDSMNGYYIGNYIT